MKLKSDFFLAANKPVFIRKKSAFLCSLRLLQQSWDFSLYLFYSSETFYILLRNLISCILEFLVKKLGLLIAAAALFTSCAFDSDESGVSNWLSSHGMPDSYKVQVITIENLKAENVSSNWYGKPRLVSDSIYANFGRKSNVVHDVVFDFVFAERKSYISDTLNASDSTACSLLLYGDRTLYSSKSFPKDSLPIKEEMDVTVSWKLELSDKEKLIDNIIKSNPLKWVDSLSNDWTPDASGDTTFSVSLVHADSVMVFPLPSALMEALKKMKHVTHMQLRLSAPNAKNLLRIQSYGSFMQGKDKITRPPSLGVYTSLSGRSRIYASFRMANLISNKEECEDCPVLHGGVRDSLVLEIPAEPILNAVYDFYSGDTLAVKGNGMDVRQTIVLAELTMARDDAKGNNEFGLPIQVVVGSYLDSADTSIRHMESYRLNKDFIYAEGHKNLVFTDGDSLTLQVSQGVKELVNKGDAEGSLKIMMKMGFPLLNAKDSAYTATAVAEGDTTNKTFFTQFDYARYDFSAAVENPMRLKLWMASKRGGEK